MGLGQAGRPASHSWDPHLYSHSQPPGLKLLRCRVCVWVFWRLTASDSPCPCPYSGYVFVDLSSEEEVKKALKCNREYMGKGVSGISEDRPLC